MTDKLIKLKSIKTKRTKLNKQLMKSGWRNWLLVGGTGRGTQSMGGTLNELIYEAAEPQRMTVLSGFMVTGNYQTNLTCVEHWLPLFAAK